MFCKLVTQSLLDSVSTFLIYNYLLNQSINKNNKNLLWILITTFIYIIARIDTMPVSDTNQIQIYFKYSNYDLFPVNSLYGVLFLVLALMILNCYLFKSSDSETLYLTLTSIVIFISVRFMAISIFKDNKLINSNLYEYTYRFFMLFLLHITLVIFKLPLYKLKRYLVLNKYTFKIMVVSSFLFIISLVSFYEFNTAILMENMIFILIIILIILIINIITLIFQRDKLIKKKRIEMLETYVPVIDDLIDEVRAKQHEFDNKILAIYSILETSQNIEEAKNKISLYSDSMRMDNTIREMMNIDNKVIAGFIYSKFKLAKFKNIMLDVKILTVLDKLPIEEYKIIEILGILIDNAIEASFYNDIIYLEIKKNSSNLEIVLKNPYKYTSPVEFSKMFELGYSTKAKSSRGYGLHNIKTIINDCKGNILFTNNTINDINYISIGVLIPFYY